MSARSLVEPKQKDLEFNRFYPPKLQHESLLLKQDPIMDFSTAKDFNVEKQRSYAKKSQNQPMEEDIMLTDSKVLRMC